MKKIILGLLTVGSLTVFANQEINCSQIKEDGTVLKNGVKLNLIMIPTKGGNVTVEGQKNDLSGDYLKEQTVISVSQESGAYDTYTTFNMVPKNDDVLFDIQLRFNSEALWEEFSNLNANYSGWDDTNQESGLHFNYNLVCDSKIN